MTCLLAFIAVVRTHDRPRAAFLNGSLECRKIYFIKGSVVNHCVIFVTAGLLVVQGIMFHAGCHAVGLYALNVWNNHSGCEERILAHIFEIAAAERSTVDVHTGTEKDILLAIACLFTD